MLKLQLFAIWKAFLKQLSGIFETKTLNLSVNQAPSSSLAKFRLQSVEHGESEGSLASPSPHPSYLENLTHIIMQAFKRGLNLIWK